MTLFRGGPVHLSPRWGLGVGRFNVFLYTYRLAEALGLRLLHVLRAVIDYT